MRFGRFTLQSTMGSGPAGPIYLATDEAGVSWELRTLVGKASAPETTKRLGFRWRLLKLLTNDCLLKPEAVELGEDPPFIAVPVSDSVPKFDNHDEAREFAYGLSQLLAASHRIGLTLGGIDASYIRRCANGRLRIDLTGVGWLGLNELPAESTSEEDVLRLGELLETLLKIPSPNGIEIFSNWRNLVRTMRLPQPEDRPLAIEVARWFDVNKAAQRNHLSSEVEATNDSIPPSSFSSGSSGPRSNSGIEATIDSSDKITIVKKPRKIPSVGDQLGRFTISGLLGEGGMGVVFKAEDQADGKEVAVKVLKPEAAASQSSRKRFVKEVRMLAKLDSPFVTRLIAADTEDEICYMAVEYVPGQNVGDFLRAKGAVPEKVALEMIADAARGVAVAHRLGIIHRDIKPDNLLMLPEGHTNPRLKVTDFGLARLTVQSESLEVTKTGVILGTPRFMAPEQFGGKKVDARADVYALGATLFYLLTGQPVFPQTNLMELTRAVVSDPAPVVDRVNPSVSSATSAFVAKCLAKDAVDRPSDAGVFLREVERLLKGEVVEVVAHPLTPMESNKSIGFTHTWELESSPASLWPHVSNTERLNRAVGLPALKYEIRRDPVVGTKRFAHAKVLGFKMEWEEHPFEWVEGRRMGILREFNRGPFVWMLSVVELTPKPGGGTILNHTLRAEPRNWLGKFIAPSNLGKNARKGLDAVYRRIDQSLKSIVAGEQVIDSFEPPSRLPKSRQRRLDSRIERLMIAGASRESSDILGLYLANAPDQEVARIKPLALARRFAIDENAMIETCLRGVGEGLLQLQWDVICPLCRIPSGHRDTLKEILEHESCQTCDAAFQTDFASAVELVFRVHPEIREIEKGTYCAGGPAHSPHVVAQIRLAPSERIELPLALSEGLYRIRGPQLTWNIDLRVTADAVTDRWEINLESQQRETLPAVSSGSQILIVQNGPDRELMIRIERSTDRDDVLTAARALALPAFRELFPGEVLSPGQLAPASTITLFQACPDRSEELFKTLGEARAFLLIQATLRIVEARVKAEGGVVVKSVGEGLLAAFNEVSSAVRTALSLPKALDEDQATFGTTIKTSIHRGMAMVATINNQLDYFGQTPRVAGKLLDLAGQNQLAITAVSACDHDINALFENRQVKLTELTRAGASPILTYLVPLEKPAY